MSAWEDSRAAARLKAAASVEVAEPPPLAAVRQVAKRRARRSAQLIAFAVALPLGALAAVGGYAWKRPPLPLSYYLGESSRGAQTLSRLQAPRDSADATILRGSSSALLGLRAKPAPGGEGRGEGAVRVQKAAPVEKPAQVESTPAVEMHAPIKAPSVVPVVVKPVARPVAPTRGSLTPALSPQGEREVTPAIPASGGYAPPPAPAHTSLADEAAALSEALSALRSAHDAALALGLLTRYQARFPAGALRHEAALATAEAHRTLGHSAEALAALDALPRRPDLDVLRAELNAELGHCDVARSVLRGVQATGTLRERALFTDATCALQLGARDEAISALEQAGSPRASALLEKLR